MKNYIYFDTEFTSLAEDNEFISIGLIHINGQSFYAESNEFDSKKCSDFCQHKVIIHLENKAYSLQDITYHLSHWLFQFKEPILVCDSVNDIEQFNQLFSQSSAFVNFKVMSFGEQIKRRLFKNKVYNRYKLKTHHSLDDAQVNKIISTTSIFQLLK